MKRILRLLLAILPALLRGADAKLGSEADPIRKMLFASQSLQEQVGQIHLNGQPGSFRDIVDAAKLAQEGQKKDAILKLEGALQRPDNEPRVTLWIWAGLRELGVQPAPKLAGEVLGAIIEMPSGGGYSMRLKTE